tara:strand:- start:358 stop:522 length:165 start_codon:yes stop_codon:yes gene_type:complete
MLNQTNKEIGKLLWEQQLFEGVGNYVAADRIGEIIKKIREEQDVKDEDKHELTA